ncbi:MAG: hypothetical protein F2520_05855 [Actinobacteria bacterium]|uniref:Unannotated protein n=1 Tax=freshwater metagenome TaxID=449393 RepID=A0A6J7I4W2_9ZZZZ|nr:hypothetical protein [Actinomycetota bacterium]MTA77766.1 hypothetical protein [Actinomycetota bacterium]
MERLIIAGVLIVIAVAVSVILQRRRPAPPSGSQWNIPAQLDRLDFRSPHAPWLVAVFTSATCDACSDVVMKADALRSDIVEVQELEVAADADLHRRYGIDAVPLILIAGHDGVVARHFLGPVTATDLWAAVAEAREPGSTPESCHEHQADHDI